MKKQNLLISFSGGRTSAFMTKWLLENKSDEYNFIVVYANTGHEREETLEFVNECDKRWNFNTIWVELDYINNEISHKIVDFNSAYRNHLKNGEDPFEKLIEKRGMPNMNTPFCSEYLKKYPINKYMRSIGLKKKDYKTILGIRSDEPSRLNWDRAKKENIKYFAEFGKVTKNTINKFWGSQDFDLKLASYQGNCMMCWKKSNRKLYTIILEGLASQDNQIISEIEWLKHIHIKFKNFIPVEKQDKGQEVNMFRGEKNMQDLLDESLGFTELAKDESKIIESAIQLSMWNDELDGNFGCVESCEAF